MACSLRRVAGGDGPITYAVAPRTRNMAVGTWLEEDGAIFTASSNDIDQPKQGKMRASSSLEPKHGARSPHAAQQQQLELQARPKNHSRDQRCMSEHRVEVRLRARTARARAIPHACPRIILG